MEHKDSNNQPILLYLYVLMENIDIQSGFQARK